MQHRVITFSKNVFLPLTTVCRNRCGYCGFRTPVREGCLMDPAEVEKTLRYGASQGCTEALFTFGEHPEEEPGFRRYLEPTGLYYHSRLLRGDVQEEHRIRGPPAHQCRYPHVSRRWNGCVR